MKRYILLFVCFAVANAQLVNDFSTEWRSLGQSLSYKNKDDIRVTDFNKKFEGTVLSNNLSYRNQYFDITGNFKWQADGSVPVAIRENLNTYRIYAMTNPNSFYNFSLSGGFERRESADGGWVSDFEAATETEILDPNDLPIDTIFNSAILQSYQTITRPDLNLGWFGAGYEYKSGDFTILPQFNYFIRNEKGTLTVMPASEIDSLKSEQIDSEDYDWQAKVSTAWQFSPDHALQVKGFYHDDLDVTDYYNIYSAESGVNSNFVINDFMVNTYLGTGLLSYHNNDNFYGKSSFVISYKAHQNINLKLKNNFDLYQDESFSEKVSLYTAWLFSQAGYDYNQISIYTSLSSKGEFGFFRLGIGGRYWLNSWLNEADVSLKNSEIIKLMTYTYKSQYFLNKLNSLYLSTEFNSYRKNAFLLDGDDLRVTVGIQSGLY